MNPDVYKKSISGMSKASWLALRKKGIGGSDAAGIMGLSEYSSPYSVWADKTGRLPDKEDTEAMRIGRDLEQYVARRWSEETGKKVHRLNSMLYNKNYPFAFANVDRVVSGENAGLECKTTSSLNVKQFHGVEFPEIYYAQCVHYLAVTGADRWHLAVLQFGRGFYTFTLERDQAEIDALMDTERDFWELVEKDTPPAADGSRATSDALSVIYADSGPGRIELPAREGMLAELVSLKKQSRETDKRIKEIENTIKQDMGEAQIADTSDHRYTVTWKPQTRETFQADMFKKKNPQIDLSPYYKTSEFRTLRVKENK